MSKIDQLKQEVRNAMMQRDQKALERAVARYWTEVSLRQQRGGG